LAQKNDCLIKPVFRNPPLILLLKNHSFTRLSFDRAKCSEDCRFMDTAVYMRVSTTDQRLDSQERELRNYCKMRGWKNTVIYSEKKTAAVSTRPALDRMVQDIRAGKIERLVCYKLDRVGRSLTHLALIVDELAKLNVPLICTSQGIDTSNDSPCGKFQLTVLMAVAEFERGIIRERVNAGLAAARERGVKLGRPGTLAARQGEVLSLKKKGLGVRAIARDLKMPVSSVHALLSRKS
jgi:DNA invertase Pin-like site-specific DNA recombinase